MFFNIFDKKTGSGARANLNEVLVQNLHKPVIKEFKRRKVNFGFKDSIWTTDLVEMGLLYSKNRGVKYFLRTMDIFMFSPNMLVLNP